MTKNKVLQFIVFLFIALYVYTGISKLLDYHQFNIQVEQSPVLKSLTGWPLWWIPVGEILVAAALVIPRLRLLALYICLLSMISFTIYLILLTQFSDYIPCSCGGVLEKIPPNIHILLNVCLSLVSLSGIYLEKNKRNSLTTNLLK